MIKKFAYVMIGLPGTGKSYATEKLKCMLVDKGKSDIHVASTDNFIEMVANQTGKTYNEVFAETINNATKYMNEALDINIRNGSFIIFDQTNLTVKKRKKLLDKVKKYDKKFAIYIKQPENADELMEWSKRLNNRIGKTIPNHIMTSMEQSYVIPTIEEGFDQIFGYDMFGALINRTYAI